MAVHAPTVPSVEPHPYLRSLGVAALIAALVLGLLAAVWLSLPKAEGVSQSGVAASLVEAAAVIESHGAAMADHGRRLADAARLSAGPNRDHWVADGEHMVADGQGLRALAERLRSTARGLGSNPTSQTGVDLMVLSGEASLLVAEGQGAIDHGAAMVAHANVMLDLARQPGSGVMESDAALMAEDAPRTIDAGKRVRQIGLTLRAFTDQMNRSVGR